MKRQVLMMLSCGLLLLASSPMWARTWTDNTGKFSVEAELVSSQGGQVTLRKPDGSVVVLPIARLSEVDRRYLESVQKPTPKESAADVGAEQPSEPTMSGPKVSGKIHGQGFTPDRAELNGGILTLRQGKDFFADLEVKVFLGETPEGKTYNVTAKRRFGASSPQIHMKWKEPGKKLPETEFFSDGYVMKLEFGRPSRGKLPGKIDLRLPDKARSVVAGTFTIVMPGETSEPGTGEIGGKITLPPSSKGLDIWAGCLGRNSEGKLEGPATGFKLEGSSTTATATYWKPRNSILSWDQKTKSLTHKHVNRPPGWYLVYVRGNRRDLPNGGFSHEGYYDWQWVELKENKPNVTVDLSIDPSNLGTIEVAVRGATKESSVTYLPLDENGQLPFPEAHAYLQGATSAKIEGGKTVIRGLREGKYQIAVGPWQPVPAAKTDVLVKRGSTTKVELTPILKPFKSADRSQSPRNLARELDASSAHSGFIKSIAFSPDGETLASASNDRTVRLSDAATLADRAVLKEHLDQVFSVSFSPNGKVLASSGGKTVRLWNPETGQQQAVLQGHTGWVRSVAFSPDGKTLASAGRDRKIKLWDVNTAWKSTP